MERVCAVRAQTASGDVLIANNKTKPLLGNGLRVGGYRDANCCSAQRGRNAKGRVIEPASKHEYRT